MKLNEILNKKYKFSNTQIPFPKIIANEIMDWGVQNIPDENLYVEPNDYGREDDIHCTVFYGIHEVVPKKTFQILKKVQPFTIRLGRIDKFQSEYYDVLMIRITHCKYLNKIHYTLEDNLENSNTYPEYQPHCTIAYVQPNSCDSLLRNATFLNREIVIDQIVFSSSDSSKYNINLDKSKIKKIS